MWAWVRAGISSEPGRRVGGPQLQPYERTYVLAVAVAAAASVTAAIGGDCWPTGWPLFFHRSRRHGGDWSGEVAGPGAAVPRVAAAGARRRAEVARRTSGSSWDKLRERMQAQHSTSCTMREGANIIPALTVAYIGVLLVPWPAVSSL